MMAKQKYLFIIYSILMNVTILVCLFKCWQLALAIYIAWFVTTIFFRRGIEIDEKKN
ncbi:hypothetical protein HMPREF9506_02701 [Enterococcus faecalis TX0309A]|nr:hypothetical protein HMPREF9513_01330 [Enterococcus faecalis TX0645]EFU86095.1 hypothetical protein HMPREF9507_02581 [Enterococcus faecalis TX0309B]EFU92579.1 hypothetical protein HMPREF9506_02701 [Enterococcus faecalis TX0309A]